MLLSFADWCWNGTRMRMDSRCCGRGGVYSLPLFWHTKDDQEFKHWRCSVPPSHKMSQKTMFWAPSWPKALVFTTLFATAQENDGICAMFLTNHLPKPWVLTWLCARGSLQIFFRQCALYFGLILFSLGFNSLFGPTGCLGVLPTPLPLGRRSARTWQVSSGSKMFQASQGPPGRQGLKDARQSSGWRQRQNGSQPHGRPETIFQQKGVRAFHCAKVRLIRLAEACWGQRFKLFVQYQSLPSCAKRDPVTLGGTVECWGNPKYTTVTTVGWGQCFNWGSICKCRHPRKWRPGHRLKKNTKNMS